MTSPRESLLVRGGFFLNHHGDDRKSQQYVEYTLYFFPICLSVLLW